MLIKRSNTYDEAYRSFRWDIPERYNIAGDVCDRHANSDAVALIHDRGNGEVRHYRFRDIQRSANQLANVFTHYNLARGSFVAILLGQDPEAGITHVACWKAGLISVTISRLFGVEAVEHRLGISEAPRARHRQGRMGSGGSNPRPVAEPCAYLDRRRRFGRCIRFLCRAVAGK